MAQRFAGIVFVKIDGTMQNAKGNFSVGMGFPMREGIKGSDDRLHGFKETPQVAHIEGEISNTADLNIEALSRVEDSTVTVEINNGKVYALRNAFITNGEGLVVNSEEANIPVRFEGSRCEEIR